MDRSPHRGLIGHAKRFGPAKSKATSDTTTLASGYRGALRHWKSELEGRGQDAFPGIGHQSAMEEENRRLRRELADARLERDIRKKAVAIFSKPPRTGTGS